MPLEHTLGARAQPQIDISDDAGDELRRSVFARRAHCCDAVDEFGLAERFELFRSAAAIYLAGVLVHGRDDLVAAAEIREQLRDHVAVPRLVPEMMVRVDDRQLRLRDLLRLPGGP